MSDRTTATQEGFACAINSMQQRFAIERNTATMQERNNCVRHLARLAHSSSDTRETRSRLRIACAATALTIALSGCSQASIADTAAASAVSSIPSTLAASPTSPAQTLRLQSVNNFRDLAGPGGGYSTADGRRVREGVLYRSNALASSDADAATLDALGVSAVYDLRTTEEIGKNPDRVPSGARYTQGDIIGDATSAAVTSSVDLSTPQGAATLLTEANRQFVTDPSMRAQFSTLLTAIATTNGPQIFHCTGGKDRAGWVSAVLLKIAGVDDETVMSNYLLSNEYLKDSIDTTTAEVRTTKGERAAEAMRVLMGVSPEFLQAGFDEIRVHFGTFDNYVTTGLRLSTDTVDALRIKLTV